MSGGNSNRNVVAVRIAGHEYKIRSDGDADALKRIAGYVDSAMRRVQDRTGTVDTFDVAVLTCLNLAREILALHEERAPEGAAVVEADQLRDLIDRVEAVVPEALRESAEAAPSEVVAREDAGEARTLELPTPEALREDAEEDVAAGAIESPRRVAGAGGDRAS